MVEIYQGAVVVAKQRASVILNAESSPGFATSANIISENPPQLGRVGSVPYDAIVTVMPGRWSRAKMILGWKNSGLQDPASPDMTAELDAGKRRGKVKIR